MATALDKPKVYVESTTISYLTARPTEEPIARAKQILTHRWWELRESFDLYISQTVIDEIKKGDIVAAALRLQAADEIPVLPLDDNVERIADVLLTTGAMPENAGGCRACRIFSRLQHGFPDYMESKAHCHRKKEAAD
jgi:hypothetical protein